MRVSTGSATHGLRRAGVDQRRITSRGGILETAALAADARRRGRVDRAPRLLVRGDLLRALLVPERGRQDFRRDAAVLVLLRDVLDLLEERVVELGGLEAQRAELAVAHVELVLGGLLARVREEARLDARVLRDELRDVAHAPRLGDLVEDLGLGPLGRRVVDGDLDALARVRDVDEGARLAARAVDRHGHVEGRLHEEAVQHRAVVAVVVEAVRQPRVHRRQVGVRAPDDALVQIGDAHAVVLRVELEEERVEALGRVVDRAGVGGVEDARVAAAGQHDVNVTLGDLAARRAVPVHAHGAEMDDVRAAVGLDDGRQEVVRAADVVVHRVPLLLRALLRVRRGALLGEVDDGVGPLVLD